MKILLSITAIALALNFNAQKGKTFPTVIGISLTEQSMSLPIKNGKYSIVAIAFNKAAEDELKRWLNPLYDVFMNKDKGKNSMSTVHDVNFFFVPLIGGLKMVSNKFKETTDKAFWPYIMDTDKWDIKVQQKSLDIEDGKVPYFFVLDKDGKIIEMQSGKFSDDKVDVLEEAVETK
jgi:hypothetical protein